MKFFQGATQSPNHHPLHLSRKKILILVTVAIGVAAVIWGAVIYFTPQAQKDLNAAKSAVGRHMILPSNEEPTLAIVTDRAKITNKFLASKARDGDELLIYTQNQIAIIYRPSVDKIVAVATVTADSALAESQKATITVLNGADNAEKTQKVIAQLKATYPDMTVTDGGAANKHDYTTTIVIDNSGEKDYLVDALAQLIGGSRGVVPISETASSTDLMIIVGKNV